VEPKFDVEKKDGMKKESKKSTRRLDLKAEELQSEFNKALTSEKPDGDCERPCPLCHFLQRTNHYNLDEKFFSYLKKLSPAAVDLELRQLYSLESIRMFMGALMRRLRSHKDFEAIQTFLNVFLRLHGEVLVENEELQNLLNELLEVQKTESGRIVDQISAALGTLSFVRDSL